MKDDVIKDTHTCKGMYTYNMYIEQINETYLYKVTKIMIYELSFGI